MANVYSNAFWFDPNPHEVLRRFFLNLMLLDCDWENGVLEYYLDWESGVLVPVTEMELALYAPWIMPAPDKCKGPGEESDGEKLLQVLSKVLTPINGGYDRYISVFGRLAKFVKGRRGRPRTQGLNALLAYVLHFIGGLSWPETTLRIRGSCRSRKCSSYCAACDDVRRSTPPGRYDKDHCHACGYLIRPVQQRKKVCPKCADSTEDLVSGFLRFLQSQSIIRSPRRRRKRRRNPGEN